MGRKLFKISRIILIILLITSSFLVAKKTSFYDWESALMEHETQDIEQLKNEFVEGRQEPPRETATTSIELETETVALVQELPIGDENIPEKKDLILFEVPFTAQAPLGEWSDPRQQDGCEESSVLMAMAWVRGEKTLSPEKAKEEILALADYELEKYGSYTDTSASTTLARLFNDYYDYKRAELEYDFEISGIIEELEKGNIIIAPFDGRVLGNPYYTAPGPERHMLVIIGYDYKTKEFITNDPGTRKGGKYRYKQEVLIKALRDYPSGEHEPILENRRAMIIITKIN